MNTCTRYAKQSGFSLASSMILLTIVSVLTVTGAQVAQIQEKASQAMQDKSVAFVSAESALLSGEEWLLSQAAEPSSFVTCSAHPCLNTSDLNANFSKKNNSWWNSNGIAYQETLHRVETRPTYVIEYIRFVPDTPVLGSSNHSTSGVYYYRLSAHGNGTSDNGRSVLQETLARRY